MNNNITVIIPTSPIPSHPATEIIDETILNVRKYTDAKIIIMCDGVHESLAHRTEDYDQYKNNIQGNAANGIYGSCEVKIFEWHTHQAEMTKQVLNEVITPLILFCEHDTSPIGQIDFMGLIELLKCSAEINYVRFNIFHKILDEHQYLMLDVNPIELMGIKLVRTIQYSQRPHIAKTKWYKDILWTYFKEGEKTMIEDVIHGIVIEKYKALKFDTFGLAIYTPVGNQLRSYHSDGRGEDKKIITG